MSTSSPSGAASQIPIGTRADLSFTVAAEDTAVSLGSGDVAVLATPRAIAWAEAASCAAVADLIAADLTTVGTHVAVDHLAPIWVGGHVTASAMVRQAEGRRLVFEVRVTDATGAVVLAGDVHRSIVSKERFGL